MAGSPLLGHVVALARRLISLSLMAGAGAAHAQPIESPTTAPGSSESQIEFNIPAQPLPIALDQFANAARQSVLFDDELVDGRSSAAVQGRYTPLAALHALLAGTGLTAENVGGSRDRIAAFVLKTGPEVAARDVPAELHRRYDGSVQAGVWKALCADPRTAPSDYRAMLRFQVDAAGLVRQARLLASTGNRQRDAAVISTLSALRVEPPPPDLRQPLTLIVLPLDAVAQARVCQPVP
jgi:TonB family protein